MTTTILQQTGGLQPFSHLADCYEQIGLARFSEELMPRLIMWAQQNDWIGRRVMDLGCGTGSAATWLGRQGFRVIGVDISNAMLVKARLKAQTANLGLSWRQQDIRALEYTDATLDMVTCLGVLNYMRTPRELESVFTNVHRVLLPDKLFVFDLMTVKGLAERWDASTRLVFDNRRDLLVLLRATFSYETLHANLNYIIFRRTDTGWDRLEENHLLRGYPIQIATSLLERTGFSKVDVYTSALEPFDAENDREGRAIFVARKPPA